MDWFSWWRKRNRNEFEPPDMSGDSSRGNIQVKRQRREDEEELERLRRENEELRRSKMIAEILEPMKEFARLFEKEKPLIEEYLGELKVMAQTLLERDRAAKNTLITGCAVTVTGCTGVVLSAVTLGVTPLLAFWGLAAAGAAAEFKGIAMCDSPGIDEESLLKILNESQDKITELQRSADEVCQTLSKWKENFYAEMAVLVTEATRVLTSLVVNDCIKTRIELYKKQKNIRAIEIQNWVENGKSDLANLEKVYSHVKVCISLIRDLSNPSVRAIGSRKVVVGI
ncbi:uncharacterized protein LOC117432546 [Acipenser ruthenus]|uniref:uncharacterized protein LOC117432546 n=1 Tax=Acipenser ruthenus TaxID=7906 RepID=UPI002741ED61|nr:uncharacterized protein LOC117432546 [Acipenser ruthenus]XP_058875486.1 uncharacterized protein LOC117432546 [Acipenser ruthenus]XP_058875487.1 uncharacterized protein LOC117432546 [Acipenser ruthenus]